MEEIFTNRLLKSRTSVWRMAGLGMVPVLLATGLFTGCGKHQSATVQTATDQNTNQTADQPASVQQSLTSAPESVRTQPVAPDLKQLNRSLLRWIIANRRRPQSFEDFAATANVTIPPPPAGKKYALGKDMHVLLVDR